MRSNALVWTLDVVLLGLISFLVNLAFVDLPEDALLLEKRIERARMESCPIGSDYRCPIQACVITSATTIRSCYRIEYGPSRVWEIKSDRISNSMLPFVCRHPAAVPWEHCIYMPLD